MTRLIFRVGDVITFRLGRHLYRGRIKRRYDGSDALGVFRLDEGSGARGTGDLYVRMKDVTAITEPVLTEKERSALATFARLGDAHFTVKVLNDYRSSRGDAPVSGTTMHGLAQRGLVEGSRATVSDSGPLSWRLTKEGRDAAGSL